MPFSRMRYFTCLVLHFSFPHPIEGHLYSSPLDKHHSIMHSYSTDFEISKEFDSWDTFLLCHFVTCNNPSKFFQYFFCCCFKEEVPFSNSFIYKLQNDVIVLDSKPDNLNYSLVSFHFMLSFRHLAEATNWWPSC